MKAILGILAFISGIFLAVVISTYLAVMIIGVLVREDTDLELQEDLRQFIYDCIYEYEREDEEWQEP